MPESIVNTDITEDDHLTFYFILHCFHIFLNFAVDLKYDVYHHFLTDEN